ncbi:MAG: serpin family protein [Candidatus Sericytochromatia bacterium]
MKKQLFTFFLLAVIVSCYNNPNPTLTTKPKEPSINPNKIEPEKKEIETFKITEADIKKVTGSKLVKANNSFGTKLFLNISKENLNKNIFISPISAAMALQMLYNGASEGKETKKELEKVLEVENLSLDKLNSLNRILSAKLSNPAEDIKLNIANSIWSDSRKTIFFPEFSDNLKKFYNAEAKDVDFFNGKPEEQINKWCNEKTNGKIPKVFNDGELKPNKDDKEGDSQLILINAIHFKADWQRQFKKESTQLLRGFRGNDSLIREAMFMSDFREFKYYNSSYRYENQTFVKENNKFEVAGLNYGKDGKLSLYIFLPSEDSSLEDFYNDLSSEVIDKSIANLYETEGYISFPKFKNKNTYNLKERLEKQGLNIIFDDEYSDLDKIAKVKENNAIKNTTHYIDKIFQDSFIDVNEEGSEAAATTVIVTKTTEVSSSPMSILRFVADRPFFYIIRDNETKANLFMGSIVDPKYEE